MGLMASELIWKLAEKIYEEGDREVEFRYMAEEGYRYEQVDAVDVIYADGTGPNTRFVII